MFADYTKLVLRSYEEKRAGNTLSLRLIHPTPAQLKEECEAIFCSRYKRKDEGTLCVFFGDGNEGEPGLKAIKKCDIDKFRPLVNFLLKKTQTPDKKNIELLAWLIDFEPRPFVYGKQYPDNITVGDKAYQENAQPLGKARPTVQTGSDAGDETQPGGIKFSRTSLNKHRFNLKAKAVIIIVIILALGGGVIYWSQNKSETYGLANLKKGEACMYWAGDHYEQVSCSQQHGDTLIVALDTFRLKNFKKITRQDTITLNDIGRVWYIKINNQIEYFTSDGYYPLDPKRRLRPITDYIIRKYIHPAN